jgi:membrane protein required for colicin V production
MFNPVNWNGLDWILILVLIVSTVRAWMRGLVQALFGLLGFVGGFQLATWNYHVVGDWLYDKGYVHALSNARTIGFLIITITVVIVFELIGRGVKKAAHAVGFGMLDRILGSCFGFARGLLLGVAVIFACTAFAREAGWTDDSKLSSYFLGAARAVSFIVPYDMHQ